MELGNWNLIEPNPVWGRRDGFFLHPAHKLIVWQWTRSNSQRLLVHSCIYDTTSYQRQPVSPFACPWKILLLIIYFQHMSYRTPTQVCVSKSYLQMYFDKCQGLVHRLTSFSKCAGASTWQVLCELVVFKLFKDDILCLKHNACARISPDNHLPNK